MASLEEGKRISPAMVPLTPEKSAVSGVVSWSGESGVGGKVTPDAGSLPTSPFSWWKPAAHQKRQS